MARGPIHPTVANPRLCWGDAWHGSHEGFEQRRGRVNSGCRKTLLGSKGIRLEETGDLRRSWVRVQRKRTRLSQAETIGMEQRRGSESGVRDQKGQGWRLTGVVKRALFVAHCLGGQWGIWRRREIRQRENSVGTCGREGLPLRYLDAEVCKPGDSGLLEQGRAWPVQSLPEVKKLRVFQYLLLA